MLTQIFVYTFLFGVFALLVTIGYSKEIKKGYAQFKQTNRELVIEAKELVTWIKSRAQALFFAYRNKYIEYNERY